MGQWLRFHTYTAGDTGSIPGSGTKIPNATGPPKKKENKRERWYFLWQASSDTSGATQRSPCDLSFPPLGHRPAENLKHCGFFLWKNEPLHSGPACVSDHEILPVDPG